VSGQPVVVVRIGGRTVALVPEAPVAVAPDDTPAEAVAMVRCDTCGTTGAMAAPITYSFYDDDHFGRLELWYGSHHTGSCPACDAGIHIDLGYTLTRYPHSGTCELSLDALRHFARRISGGTLVPASEADILAAEQQRKRASNTMSTTTHVARSSAECHLYIALHPCACGEHELTTQHKLIQGAGDLVAQYWGTCPRCGIARAFAFPLDPEMPPIDSFGGTAPSRIICPGEFALRSDQLASRWPADPRAIEPARRAQAREDLAWSIRALEEVVKFVPAGADAVPAAAFTSMQGRAAFDAESGRFRTIRLQARLGAFRQLLAQLDAAMAGTTAPGAPPAETPGTPSHAARDDTQASVWLTCLDVAPARGLFAVGRVDGTVVVADIASGQPHWIARPYADRVTSVCILDDGVWTAGIEGAVVALDLVRGAVVRRFDAGHERLLMLRPGPVGQLITVGDDGHARLWRRDGGPALQTLDEKRYGPAHSVAATDDWIAIGYKSGWATIWQPATVEGPPSTWAYAGNMQPAGRSGSPLGAIAASPSGDRVAFARDRRVTLCVAGSWQRVAELHTDLACNDVQFDSTGRVLIGACSERRVYVWRRQEEVGNPHGYWSRLGRPLGHGMERGQWAQELIYSAARFAGDDQVIATSFDGTAQLFRLDEPGLSPRRVAHYGGARPGGWVDR
jgi:hypothetical protein